MAKHANLSTVQNWISGNGQGTVLQPVETFAQTFLWSIRANRLTAPPWWSTTRDNWLDGFWKRSGNDLLAGAVSTMTSKITTTSWYVEGPEAVARAYRDILLYKSDFDRGWDSMCQKWVESYLVRDLGGPCERHRRSIGDHTGPALGFAYLDASKCLPRKDPEWPLAYDNGKKMRKLHRSQVALMTDMPSGNESALSVGFSSVSRSIATALVLMEIVKYKRERLSNLPPAGILFISNLTSLQWEDIVKQYDARQRNENMETWRDLMVVCGVDPAQPTTADMFALSELPEHYDEKTATEIAVYTFALAFRTDPRDFWPVSSGPLGTATEATIQHQKAKAKGAGIIFTHIERILNSPFSLPSSCKFRFDYQDDEDDMMRAEIDHQRLKNIRLMWESSPNRGSPSGFTGRPQEGQEPEPGEGRPGDEAQAQRQGPWTTIPVSEYQGEQVNEGMISTEEARKLLLHWNLVPPEILGMKAETVTTYDVRTFGPRMRLWNDGSAEYLDGNRIFQSVSY